MITPCNTMSSAVDLALSRRRFLQASGGLVITFSLFGPKPALARDAAQTSLTPPPAGKLYAWLAVHPDNTATLFTGKVETGIRSCALRTSRTALTSCW